MGWLDKLFGRSSAPSAVSGLMRAVRCNRCGTIVRVRIDPRNDLSLNDDSSGYLLRKIIVDDTCFSRIEMVLTFDLNRRETDATITGGTFVQEDA